MLDASDISTNSTSAESVVLNQDIASIHVVWTGSSPVGVITVEAKNGDKDSAWRVLDMGATINVSGNSGEHDLTFTELPFHSLRIVYTAGGGTGSLDAVITSKTVGS